LIIKKFLTLRLQIFGAVFENNFVVLQNQIVAMIKKYSFILFFLFAFSAAVSAQEGLGFYPNPVSNGKIYITSKSALDKEVTIFDVLGKKVLQTITSSKEVNITALSPGVYIIKIREGEATATRKLIVK
jgi:hypothetical protein